MAVYRHIHIDYWQDGFILDLTPEEKYFYIYLMTNSKTSQSGIYELPKRIIETETGYNRETVEKLINRFEDYKKIVYCNETKEIFIKNWMKHNKANSPKVKKCIEKELANIKSDLLKELFLNECNKYGYSIDSIDKPIPKVDCNLNNHYGEKEKEKQKEKQKEKYKNKNNRLNLSSQKEAFNNKVCNNESCNNGVGNGYVCNKYIDDDVCNEHEGDLKKFKILYEENVGLINPIVGEWLIEVCERVDYELFKRAIEIATDKGKCNKGYINGILKQWNDNNIRCISDLKSYEVGFKSRGDNYGRYKNEHTKLKYANVFENEDEGLYRKPTDEEIRKLSRELEGFKE